MHDNGELPWQRRQRPGGGLFGASGTGPSFWSRNRHRIIAGFNDRFRAMSCITATGMPQKQGFSE